MTDFSAEQVFKYIINTPYKQILNDLKAPGADEEVLANNLLMAMTYLSVKRADNALIKKPKNVKEDWGRTSFYFYNELNSESNQLRNYKMNTEGKFKLFKEQYLLDLREQEEAKAKKEIDESEEKKSPNEKVDKLLADCTAILKSGDSKLRGSSNEYREIQSEITKLRKFIHDFSEEKKLSESKTNSDFQYNSVIKQHYINSMLLVIGEKMTSYLNRRSNYLLNHSFDNYKGNRILCMNKAVARLNAMLEIEKPEIRPMNNFQATDFRIMLTKKAKEINFSPILTAEIKSIYNTNNGSRVVTAITEENKNMGIIQGNNQIILASAIDPAVSIDKNGNMIPISNDEYVKKYMSRIYKYEHSNIIQALDETLHGHTVNFSNISYIHNQSRIALGIHKNKEKVNENMVEKVDYLNDFDGKDGNTCIDAYNQLNAQDKKLQLDIDKDQKPYEKYKEIATIKLKKLYLKDKLAKDYNLVVDDKYGHDITDGQYDVSKEFAYLKDTYKPEPNLYSALQK